MRAVLKIAIGSVDETNGIVTGCKLAEVNALAIFAGKDGQKVELKITPGLVDELLGLSTSAGRLDAYWTHDRLNKENKDSDPLHDSIGVWKNFRKDEEGNPIADLHLEPSEYRERVLWKAKHDPQGIMTSLVFEYTGDTNNAHATAISSGDLVRYGAATTALLSAYPDNLSDKTMDVSELFSLLDDPSVCAKVSAMVKAAMKEHNSAEEDAAMSEDDMTAAMAAAGVTEADKKAEDAKKSPATRAVLAISRAATRQLAALTEAQKKAPDEAATKAEAKFTALLGKGGFSQAIEAQKGADDFNAKVEAHLAAMPTGKKDRGLAIARAAKDNPKLYDQARANGKI